jgi:Protein of unknown function DUF262
MIKTAPSSLKIRQIITDIQNKTLIPRPEFQRRLVWSMADKNNFIDTILRGYPFPEIYIADGEVDLETGEGAQQLVDGNLGIVTQAELIEIFRRINSTNYSLNDMEINNAMYAGRFKSFCETLANLEFFERHKFFRPMQLRRMGDVKYVASIIVTMLGGYFNRDDVLEEYLQRFNDVFPQEEALQSRFLKVLSTIEELQFDSSVRVWKQTDFFTLACEIDDAMHTRGQKINISRIRKSLGEFYALVETSTSAEQRKISRGSADALKYFEATIQAANDRRSRVTRGQIIRTRLAA